MNRNGYRLFNPRSLAAFTLIALLTPVAACSVHWVKRPKKNAFYALITDTGTLPAEKNRSARELVRQSDWPSLVDLTDRFIESGHKDADTYNLRALALLSDGYLVEGVQSALNAYRAAGPSPESCFNIIYVYSGTRVFGELKNKILPHYLKECSGVLKTPDDWYALSDRLYYNHRYWPAEATARSVLKNPEFKLTPNHRIKSLYQIGLYSSHNRGRALKVWRQYFRAGGNAAQARFQYAVLIEKNRPVEARQHMRLGRQTLPSCEKADRRCRYFVQQYLGFLGRLEFRTGNYEQAALRYPYHDDREVCPEVWLLKHFLGKTDQAQKIDAACRAEVDGPMQEKISHLYEKTRQAETLTGNLFIPVQVLQQDAQFRVSQGGSAPQMIDNIHVLGARKSLRKITYDVPKQVQIRQSDN